MCSIELLELTQCRGRSPEDAARCGTTSACWNVMETIHKRKRRASSVNKCRSLDHIISWREREKKKKTRDSTSDSPLHV